MNIERKCATCVYRENDTMECRLSPPQAIHLSNSTDIRGSVQWRYPMVRRHDWCYQWIEKLDKQPESLLDEDHALDLEDMARGR